jgi:hypothetical protein
VRERAPVYPATGNQIKLHAERALCVTVRKIMGRSVGIVRGGRVADLVVWLGWHDGGGVDGGGGLGTLAAVVQGRMRLFWEGTVDRRGRGEKDPVCLDLVGVTAREWPDGVCGGDWVRCRVLRMWKDGGVGLRADR